MLRYFVCFVLLNTVGFSQSHLEKTPTQIADSLDKIGEYTTSLKYRDLALNNSHSNSYSKYLKAKWHYTKACIHELTGGIENHKKAVEHSLKAKDLIEQIQTKTTHYYIFKHEILNRIYHQYGYQDQWHKTLRYALEDLKTLKDTFPEHHEKVLYIMDDLGYIYNIMNDPQRSNEYYEASHKLYRKFHPENQKDLYWNYNRITNNHKILGLKQEEFKLLKESEIFWENSNEEDAQASRFNTYKKLANWYIFYGDYAHAETYLNKQANLLDYMSNSHKPTEKAILDIRDKGELFDNYIKLYLNTNNKEKANHYITTYRALLKQLKQDFLWSKQAEADLYLYEARLPDTDSGKIEHLLQNAISTAKTNQKVFFIDPIPYQLELFEHYKNQKNTEKAIEILESVKNQETLEANLKFYTETQLGSLQAENERFDLAKTAFNKALESIIKPPKKSVSFQTISIGDIKEFYSYTTVEGFLLMGDFHLNLYKTHNKKEDFNAAFNLFLLASKVFDNIYIGDKYNSKLFKYYKEIEKRLVFSLQEVQTSKNIELGIEALENNSSKLTWSKFVYSKSSQQLNIPDSIRVAELKLKTLLNHYQNQQYQQKKEFGLPTDSLKTRIEDLKSQLTKQQNYIKTHYGHYFNRNANAFNIATFKDGLNKDQVVIKYVLIENSLFAFSVDKNQTKLAKIVESENLSESIKNYGIQLSTFNSKHVIPEALSKVEQHLTNLNKSQIIIIPTDLLSLIPFETLVTDYTHSKFSISYSSSLNLLAEQWNTKHTLSPPNVGIFAAKQTQNNSSNYLPYLTKEIESISKFCSATVFEVTSKHEFLSNASKFNILHLATHSSIDNENPELSHLAFHDDELLVAELYNQTLTSNLAVLSACDTGNGYLLNGEGVQSISKAFTYAGIPSTVMSLWKVDDKATAQLMGSFYKHLQDGQPKDVALKLAKQDYLQLDIDQELKHPYYWSGFVLSGNTEPFKKEQPFNYWYLSFLILPIAAFAFLKLKA